MRLILAAMLAAAVTTDVAAAECVDFATLLDPATAPAARAGEFERLERSAAGGSALANFVLGTLYRLGPDHPAAATPRADARAEALLARAAAGGRFEAMPALAEIEYARKDYLKAHLWAELGRRYMYRHGYTFTPVHYHHIADLGRRMGSRNRQFYAGKKGELAREYIGGFVTDHGEAIDEGARHWPALGMDACAGADPTAWPVVWDKSAIPDRRQVTRGVRAKRQMNAVFYLEVATDGSVAKAFLIDGWPTPAMAATLAPTLRFIRFNAIATNGPRRAAIMPVADNGRLLKLALRER